MTHPHDRHPTDHPGASDTLRDIEHAAQQGADARVADTTDRDDPRGGETPHGETTMTEPAHHRDVARGVTLTLNTPFVERIGPDGVAAYCAAIQALAAGPRDDVDAIAAELRRRLDAAGIELSDRSYGITAEQIAESDGVVSVVTDGGQVLLGDRYAAAPEARPDVQGTEDPDHPDRPAYS